MCHQDWPPTCLLFNVFLLSSVVRYSCVVMDKLGDLVMYLSLSVMCCISAELSYMYQTVDVWIGKWLAN